MFEDFDWNSFGRRFVEGTAAALPGAYFSSVAGRKISSANRDAAGMVAQTGQAHIDQLERIRRQALMESAPGIAHYRATLAQPAHVLTPGQATQLQDTQRQLNQSNMLGRLGGRAFSRTFADVTDRFKAGAERENARRQDTAAGQLFSRGNIGYNAAARQGDVISDVGGAQANLRAASGENEANTMAAIGTYFANAMKDADRERRYREYQGSPGRY